MLAGVTELLPAFAAESPGGRGPPGAVGRVGQGPGRDRVLPAAPAGRFGGLEADPVTFYTAVRLIASACGSTGWVASVIGVHPWQLALFPPQAQQDVWGADPATRMSSSYAPTGRARLVEGGATG